MHNSDHCRDAFRGALRSKSRGRREALARSVTAERTVGRRNDLLPKLDLVEREIGSLRPPARNVRKVDPGHVREVANSIETLGFCAPILIDADGVVIDGLVRLEGAKRAGLDHVPCVLVGHLMKSELRTLRLALNRLQEKGAWDLGELKIELEELILDDAPIEIAGFSAVEIDQIRLDEGEESVEQGPVEPDAAAEPIARPGDVFDLGPHRIACGDARDETLLARLLGGDEVRLVLTDVPYNVPIKGHVTGGDHREFPMARGEMTPDIFEAFNADWMRAARAHLAEGGVLGTFIDWRGYPTVDRAATSCGLAPLNLVVWSKTNAGMGSLYRSGHELLPLYKKGTASHVNNVELGRHGRWRSNVWTYPGASSIGSDARKGLTSHPTVKPTAMLEDALLDLTHRGEIVLDPFLGSGSTLIASEKAGRICRGIELDPLYVDVVLRRYEAVTGTRAVRIEGPPDP